MNLQCGALLLLLAFLAQPIAAAEPKAKLPDTFDAAAVDAFLSNQVKEPNRVGFSVAIVKDGKVVLAKGYGKRSLQDNQLVESDTIFCIGSVTKQFVCGAILLLAEEGKLSVHDPVAKYYPRLTRAKEITLLDLMNHVSGYPDYYPLDFVDRRMLQPIGEDELLRQYAGGKLDFEPGTKWSYSNTGYILLGRVVEKASGENLGMFLARRIFKPLEMRQTAYELNAPDPHLALGYATFALSDPELAAPEASGWLRGAGGIYSTPTDLAKWDLALISGKVLKPESYELMTTPRKTAGGRSAEYGCGVGVRMQAGRQVISHTGATSGFNTYNAIVPSTRSAVIMISNLEGGMGSLPGQILALLLKESSNVPAISGPSGAETVKTVLAQFQKGKVRREQFSDEFNHFLTDARIASAAKRLKPYGKPKKVEVLSTRERGGMEVTTTRLTFATGELQVVMYRMPDGKIEQFFVSRD